MWENSKIGSSESSLPLVATMLDAVKVSDLEEVSDQDTVDSNVIE